ncbi:MAG: T9SS type A sorting domain-containing protein [Bacteroidota bacterium]
MKILKTILILVFVTTFCVVSYGFHTNTGEITYRCLGGLTYEAEITTYSNNLSPVDRPELDLSWGDGNLETLQRSEVYTIPNTNMNRNRYIGTHTYALIGTYILSFEDPNRDYGIVNIPNSINTPFYVTSTLIINWDLDCNNSPVFLNSPVDSACLFHNFISNQGAYDIDGDSLSYKLITCKGHHGVDIPGYTYPQQFTTYFGIDSITGDLRWDLPDMSGEYDVAIQVEEWRNGSLMGSVTRDRIIVVNHSCDKTGIENHSGGYNIEVFPNPSHDNFNIKSYLTKNINIEIHDIAGKLIFHRNCQSNENVDISEIAKGIYIVSINDNKDVFNYKLLIE